MSETREKIVLAFVIGFCAFIMFGAFRFLIWNVERTNTRANTCNMACGDKRINIEDNKCYCLNGKDWIYKLELEDK